MSIGKRIAKQRKQKNFSQEYIAEKLDVSRQAVSKWEQDLTNPDTGNLIKLAELFDVSVEYLATGKTEEPPTSQRHAKRFKLKRKQIVCITVALVICLIVAIVVRIYTLPVEWDSGACGGGYATHIFDKYSDDLVQKYLDGSDRKDEITSIEAVRGTQEAEWEDRTLYLHFDIQYEHKEEGTITENITFIGHRYWFDTYKWGGAIIVG
ncbi:MAG: helix-turn-helix transcriptional regulator [Oscillospiraceae bacterium]|nr:helix-turn-helix transcriptional regulator [Oscillospiraceae bacterium]